MTLNEHVLVDTESSTYVDTFYPEEGYAIWRDNEEGNLDENGEPYQYYLQYNCLKRFSESEAPHIWAKLIDDTMEVYGKVNQPEVMALGLEDEETTATSSHTYVDENGVERQKKGVY